MHWLTELDLDAGAFMTVAISVAVAIICAFVAYRISIEEAREEIAEAFEAHIEKLHADHVDFVEAVKDLGTTEKMEE